MKRLLYVGAALYVLIVVVFAALQKQLIFPGHASQGQRWARIASNVDGELLSFKSGRGDTIVALFGKALDEQAQVRGDAATRPTIIFFYGNAMSLADTIGILRGMQKLGANTLGIEYPGYGMSSGAPGEAAFYSAADAGFDYLLTRNNVDPHKIIAAGLSLGTGVAVELAARKAIAGLALLAPYTSMDDMARHVAPFIPTGAVLQHHFRSIEKIGNLKIPIVILRGRHDSIIPPAMSQKLANAAVNADVDLREVDSDHNDLFELATPQISSAMSRLIERVAHSP